MIRLSANVNKIATIRNSRGGAAPSVVDAARACVAAGVHGITVHPRLDERHITRQDVIDVAAAFEDEWGESLEYNIEGDPRPDWIDLTCSVRPAQATLVPVSPGEITSHAGWQPESADATLAPAIERLRAANIRVSLFVDPDEDAIRWARTMGADRVELYTEPYARAFEQGEAAARASLSLYRRAAVVAHSLGLGINAGHDLDRYNLKLFAELPHLAEVSIGHALVSRALFVGLQRAVQELLESLAGVTS